jgi:type I restriction enzyme S subunit
MTQIEIPGMEIGIGKWKRYPAYKDSGVEWLREIPEHWEAKKIKRLCQVKRGASPRPIDDPIYFDDEGEYAWVRISDVTASNKYLLQTEQQLSLLGQSKSICLEPGELFLSIAGSVGKPIITQIKCCIHDGFVYFTRLQQNREYLFYVFSGGELYKGLGKLGTQLNLNTDTIGDIRLPVPPISEQQAIADYLDQETAKIDALIAKKERMIELLQEKRTALISHAVTKGLDSKVPMKDSGVEWLGEIPEHWEMRRLKFVTSFITSGSRGWAQYYNDEGPIFLRIGNLSRSSIALNLQDIQRVSPPEGTEGKRTRVNQYDVLISITAYIGSIAVVTDDIGEAYVNQHVALTRPRQNVIDAKWLGYCLLSQVGQDQFGVLLYGGTKDGLGLEDVTNLIILVPPLSEQQAIADYLDQETAKIDALISRIRDGIEKLKEYSTAIISAAVTGKIDVRETISDHLDHL